MHRICIFRCCWYCLSLDRSLRTIGLHYCFLNLVARWNHLKSFTTYWCLHDTPRESWCNRYGVQPGHWGVFKAPQVTLIFSKFETTDLHSNHTELLLLFLQNHKTFFLLNQITCFSHLTFPFFTWLICICLLQLSAGITSCRKTSLMAKFGLSALAIYLRDSQSNSHMVVHFVFSDLSSSWN